MQSPADSQTFNRYTYVSNNPVNRVDPSGHSWLKKAWNSFKKNTIVGGFFQAVETGDWKAFGRQVAILAISAFASVIVPGAGAAFASNFFVNVGLHILRGAAIGAVVGGISSEIMGGSFAQGAALGAIGGAIGGAVQGVTSSEQYGNWKAGRGWKNNKRAFQKSKFVSNVSEGLVPSQGVLDDQLKMLEVQGLDSTNVLSGRVYYDPDLPFNTLDLIIKVDRSNV